MELNAEMKDYIDKAVDVVDQAKDPTDWKTAKNIIQSFIMNQRERFKMDKNIQRKIRNL
jgi:hypothetical protein